MSLLVPKPSMFRCRSTTEQGIFGVNVNFSCPTGGSANTYGSWQLPPTAQGTLWALEDIYWITVQAFGTGLSATTRNTYLDIGFSSDTGSTSTNVTPLVEKLSISSTGPANSQGGAFFLLPVYIPAGNNIYVREQALVSGASGSLFISAHQGQRIPGAFPSASVIVPLGATTASTTGTAVVPGSSGAAGSWTVIDASTADDYIGFLVSSFVVDTTFTATHYTFDIGVGTAGNEKVIGQAMHVVWQNSTEMRNTISIPVWANVPAGSRIVVRGSCNGTPDSNISVIVHAMKG